MRNYSFETYRSSDGSLYVDFLFWNLSTDDADDGLEGWRIYIYSDINYGNKSTSFVDTHRLQSIDESHPYICWTDEIKTLSDAKSIAALWADCTALYIKGEGSFNDVARRLTNGSVK